MRVGPFELPEPLPDLREPHVITALTPWLDAGQVGTLALARLNEHFRTRVLGELARPGVFFDFTRYRPTIRDQDGQRTIQVPNVSVSLANPPGGPDLLFVNVLEPHLAAEDYIEGLAELLRYLGVRRHVRIGAWYDAVPHTRPLPVTYTLNGQPVPLQGSGPVRGQGRYQGPTSIMNGLTDLLERDGMETASLTVRLPLYSGLDEDLTGVARLLRGLAEVYPLPPGLLEAARNDAMEGERLYEEINAKVEADPAVRRAVRQMEARYDALADEPAPGAGPPPLSPEIERFLRDISDRPPGEPRPPGG